MRPLRIVGYYHYGSSFCQNMWPLPIAFIRKTISNIDASVQKLGIKTMSNNIFNMQLSTAISKRTYHILKKLLNEANTFLPLAISDILLFLRIVGFGRHVHGYVSLLCIDCGGILLLTHKLQIRRPLLSRLCWPKPGLKKKAYGNSEKPNKLSTSTKQLRERRRQMKRNGTPTYNIGYSEICKAVRRKVKADIYKHDEKQIIEAIENSKSLKKTRQKQRLGKNEFILSGKKTGHTGMIKTE